MTKIDGFLPHQHLFTRLRPSPGRGVGVFAIRDIPLGINPFYADEGDTVLVPLQRVHEIDDPDLRSIYFDFCPLLSGDFLAPTNFNLMSVGWYMNHSDRPNVTSDGGINFSTAEHIAKGDVLTLVYTTFSDHARLFIDAWKDNGEYDAPSAVLQPGRAS